MIKKKTSSTLSKATIHQKQNRLVQITQPNEEGTSVNKAGTSPNNLIIREIG